MQYNTPPDFLDTIKDLKTRLCALELGGAQIHSEVPAEVSTTAAIGSPVDLGGPSITVQVSGTGLVLVYVQADLKVTGDSAQLATARISGPDITTTTVLQNSGITYVTLGSIPTATAGSFVGAVPPLSGLLAFPASKGTHTYTILYGTSNGGTATAWFKNRKMWAWAL